jgi:hypothetical protein
MSDNGSCDVPRVALGLLLSQEENRRFLVECRKKPERNQGSNLKRIGEMWWGFRKLLSKCLHHEG